MTTVIRTLEKYPYKDYWENYHSPENYGVSIESNRTFVCEFWIDGIEWYQAMLKRIESNWLSYFTNGFSDNDHIEIRIKKSCFGVVDRVILTNKSIQYG